MQTPYDRRLQLLHCTRCGEKTPISRSTIQNPELMVILIERFEQDHKNCSIFATKRRAQAERRWQTAWKQPWTQ